MIPLLRVERLRAMGDKRLVAVATVFPVLFILALGLLAGGPKEPIGLVHPSARLLSLARRAPDLVVRLEASRAALVDDILRGRVEAGLIEQPARQSTSGPGSAPTIRADFVAQSANTGAVETRTDIMAILDLLAAEGTHTTVTDTALARARIPAAMSPFSYVAPSDLVLFMGITLLVLSAGQVETRRLGVLQRLAAAPVRGRSVIAAQIVGKLLIAAGQAAGLLLLGWAVFGVHWGNIGAVALVVAFLALSLAGVSVLIGTWAKTPEQAIATSTVVGIVAGMLGGCFYPLDVVGTTVRDVGHLVPQAWAMDAFVSLVYNNGTFVDVLPDVGVLALFGLALCALGGRAYARTMYSPG